MLHESIPINRGAEIIGPRRAKVASKSAPAPLEPGVASPAVVVPAPDERSSTGTGDTFGSRLRDARERAHITLESIASATKIKQSLLAALERDDVSQWPTGIYRRAFLRDYATAIGLRPEDVLVEFLRLFPAEEQLPAPPVGQLSDELRLTLAVERRSGIRLAFMRGLAAIRAARRVSLAGIREARRASLAWIRAARRVSLAGIRAARRASLAWIREARRVSLAWIPDTQLVSLAGKIAASLSDRFLGTVTATYAVSLEFETKAPLTRRGTVRATNAHTCLVRAFRQTIKEFPAERWSSLVVVLKRVEEPSDSAVAEREIDATPWTEDIPLNELPLPSRARSPRRDTHQPPQLPSVPPQPTARLGGGDQSVGR